jgi:predicted amidohydrolase
MGEILQTETDHEAVFTCSLSLEKLIAVRNRLPFLKDADPFIIGC